MIRKIDRRLSSRLHWANDAVWFVPCFSYSIIRPLTHRIVSSCNLSQARSWVFEAKIARSDRDAVYLPSHFTGIKNRREFHSSHENGRELCLQWHSENHTVWTMMRINDQPVFSALLSFSCKNAACSLVASRLLVY